MFNLLSLLLLVTLVQGAPLSPNSLEKRNPCDGIDSGVELLRKDGNCDSLLKRAPMPTKALNIILEQAAYDHSREMKWLFYAVNFGTSSVCAMNPTTVITNIDSRITGVENEVIPMIGSKLGWAPAGTYAVHTAEGDCQYKNNGDTNNAGALWCGNTLKAVCKSDPNKNKPGMEGVTECKNLPHNPSVPVTYSHRPVITCEW